MAALRLADVLLVNPVRDGLNLVAKEGVTINERDAVLVLSREAGVWDELGEWSVGVNPFDVASTAEALHHALTLDDATRRAHAAALREAATRRGPHDWFNDQLDAAQSPH
jgi:trehalose 6-phosphate synthase